MRRVSIALVSLCVLGVLSVPVGAAEPPEAIDRVDIDRFQIDGDTVLGRSAVDSIFTRFTGKARASHDIDAAIKALETAYHKRGYVLAH